MNQTRLSERIVERPSLEARADGDAWLPVLGWISPDRRPFGLGVEPLGPDSSPAQWRVLPKCVAMLAWDGKAQLAIFNRPDASARRGAGRGI